MYTYLLRHCLADEVYPSLFLDDDDRDTMYSHKFNDLISPTQSKERKGTK